MSCPGIFFKNERNVADRMTRSFCTWANSTYRKF
jgi:hypothetical protein